MAKYRLLSHHFIAPNFYAQDEVIEYDGPPNIDMEPLDEEARTAMQEYLRKHPGATTRPVENLPKTVSAEAVEQPPPASAPKVASTKKSIDELLGKDGGAK